MVFSPVISWSSQRLCQTYTHTKIIYIFIFLYFNFILYTLLSLSGYSGCLSWVSLQQLQEQRYPVLQLASPWYDHRGWLGVKNNYLSILHVHAGSFRVSVIHRTLHTDYMIFNVRTWSFLRVRIHTEVGHTDHESAHYFWLGRTFTNLYCAPDEVRTSGLNLDLESDALRMEPSSHVDNI